MTLHVWTNYKEQYNVWKWMNTEHFGEPYMRKYDEHVSSRKELEEEMMTPYLSSHFFVQLMRYSEIFLMFSRSPLQ